MKVVYCDKCGEFERPVERVSLGTDHEMGFRGKVKSVELCYKCTIALRDMFEKATSRK